MHFTISEDSYENEDESDSTFPKENADESMYLMIVF